MIRIVRSAGLWPVPLLLASAASLASCGDGGRPANEPGRDSPASTAAVDEDPTTPGAWQTAGDDSRSVGFRAADGEPLLSIGCEARGGLLFQRHGFVAPANLGMMQLRTGGTVRRLAATSDSGDPPQVQAKAPYNDQLIPALMRFEQPLEVRTEGLDTLILPPSPAVRQLVQTCQRASVPIPLVAPAAPG